MPLDETHASDLTSWVESAQDRASDFPIQNLPLGIFHARARPHRPGVAIGDRVLDLVACAELGLVDDDMSSLLHACSDAAALNPLLASGTSTLASLRGVVSRLLRTGSDAAHHAEEITIAVEDATLCLPAAIGDYTDFYASIHHATNVGSMFRPDNPLLPNYKWVPIGYHGRASSIGANGGNIARPSGQTRDEAASRPSFGPSRRLDYELEIGAIVASGNSQGQPIRLPDAESHIAGLCLVNDWSARDIQAWEYQPLGPFLAKNFATTISPWLVTLDALTPFRVPASARVDSDPRPLPYLTHEENERAGGFDIALEVTLRSSEMRARGMSPFLVSRGNFREMYWTLAQLVTHHASNGCNLQPGDLIASGTVSGPTAESRGCLLERTWRGTEPLTLPTGETRRFLEDGDEVILRGWCEREGFRRIGFGECRGTIANPRT